MVTAYLWQELPAMLSNHTDCLKNKVHFAVTHKVRQIKSREAGPMTNMVNNQNRNTEKTIQKYIRREGIYQPCQDGSPTTAALT